MVILTLVAFGPGEGCTPREWKTIRLMIVGNNRGRTEPNFRGGRTVQNRTIPLKTAVLEPMLPAWLYYRVEMKVLPAGPACVMISGPESLGATDTLQIEVRCIDGRPGGRLIVIKPGAEARVVAEALFTAPGVDIPPAIDVLPTIEKRRFTHCHHKRRVRRHHRRVYVFDMLLQYKYC